MGRSAAEVGGVEEGFAPALKGLGEVGGWGPRLNIELGVPVRSDAAVAAAATL